MNRNFTVSPCREYHLVGYRSARRSSKISWCALLPKTYFEKRVSDLTQLLPAHKSAGRVIVKEPVYV